ncbi:MAG: phosphomannomutase/phosphoglucomutase [Chromatiales bacterium]|nr:phosphomannomutase/phosphoglucomutase [Chromatiales bacterium]
MPVDKSVFRAYDVRGIVDHSLDEALVYDIGRAIATRYPEAQSFVVGRDGRLSSPRFAEALAGGLRSAGVQVVDLGAVPTPVLYFAAHEYSEGCGLMVTGSHNPPNYNGVKMMVGKHTLAGDEIQALYQDIVKGHFNKRHGSYRSLNVMDAYIDKIAEDIVLPYPYKLVADCGNGVAGPYVVALFDALGCELQCLYCDIDGNFPNHHANPSEEKNLVDLIATVKESNAELGIAFDGDGDRLGVVDELGNIIWPDRQMMVYAKKILEQEPGACIVYDVKCSNHLRKIIEKNGGHAQMCRTGHSYVKSMLKKTAALLAGEMSGHIFFNDRWYGFDDALYTAARLVEICADNTDSSSQIFAKLPHSISTPELNVHLENEGDQHIFMEHFLAKARFNDGELDYTDGLRVDFNDGWGLVRASNTTPCLVLRFEADNAERLDEVKDIFRKQLLLVERDLEITF